MNFRLRYRVKFQPVGSVEIERKSVSNCSMRVFDLMLHCFISLLCLVRGACSSRRKGVDRIRQFWVFSDRDSTPVSDIVGRLELQGEVFER